MPELFALVYLNRYFKELMWDSRADWIVVLRNQFNPAVQRVDEIDIDTVEDMVPQYHCTTRRERTLSIMTNYFYFNQLESG